MKTVETKLILNGKKYPVKLVYTHNRIFFFAPFNKKLNAEIKMMSGHMYHGYNEAPLRDFVIKTFGVDKIWSVADDQHNTFQLMYLQGRKPYSRYQQELLVFNHARSELYGHQNVGVNFLLTRKQCILAGEMGTGKTLAEITAREIANPSGAWYVAPKSALKAVERELRKWRCTLIPEMMTYQGLVKRIKSLEGKDIRPPQWITFDESSCVKTPNTQRSQASAIISDIMREYWGDDCWIILMSGSPAPQSPLDWWMQCRVARPGYLIEGDISKLKNRLAVLVDKDFGSGIYKHIEAWKDRNDICDICGKVKNEHIEGLDDYHEFKLAINEVEKLYKRMQGLVLVQLKKDCLDLPEKRYEIIELEPTKKFLQLASALVQTSPSVIEALTRMRTLSDGFMYKEEKSGEEVCPICHGEKQMMDHVLKDDGESFEYRLMPCIKCKGKGIIPIMHRVAKEVTCPKEDALKDLIEQHSEVGRLVCYAGFTGSVNRCVRIFQEMEWEVIKWDGQGITCTVEGIDVLDLFQDKLREYPRVGFVGQPGAAGLSLTLTASPSIVYWSNTFNAVDRIQSEDRVHRISMDLNRCPTIYDLFHLPTDRLVYNNIKEKILRQDLTMGISVDMAKVLEALNA